MSGEIVLGFPEPIRPTLHVRSTLVHGGLESLRHEGLYEAYAGIVAQDVRAEIEAAVAGMWLPVETVVAHYKACDGLGLPAESAARLGRGTFDRTKGLLLGTAIGLARGTGVSPWTLAPHFQRFWFRGLDGGGIQALREGPKEMRIDFVACPVLESRYFRAALRGLVTALLELVTQKVYVHEVPGGDPETAMALRVQWV